MTHLLVVANETLPGQELLEAVLRRAREGEGEVRLTVCCPVNRPREGYVVYEDTRRASAGRRLDRTLARLRGEGLAAHGYVTDADPLQALKDAIAQFEPDEILVSTHPEQRSGWLRRDLLEQMRKAAGDLPLEHVVVDMERQEGAEANVLVIANETVIGRPLLDAIRERAGRSPASFLIVSPQNDPSAAEHPEAERRLRIALAELRGAGIDAHGQVAHPDPHAAAMHAIRDERIDEIIVSTFPEERGSSWLRGDLVERLRKDTGLPVEHVVVEPEGVSA